MVFRQFETARRVGTPALLRLRAETLLKYGDEGIIPLTSEERAKLDRIAVTPNDSDMEFLRTFDHYLEDDSRFPDTAE